MASYSFPIQLTATQIGPQLRCELRHEVLYLNAKYVIRATVACLL